MDRLDLQAREDTRWVVETKLEMALAEKVLAESSILFLSQGYAGLMGAPGPKGDPVSWFLRLFSLQVKDKRTVPPWVRRTEGSRSSTVCCFNTEAKNCIYFTSCFISSHFWPNWAPTWFQNIWPSSDPCGTCRGEPAEVLSGSRLFVSTWPLWFWLSCLEKEGEKSSDSLNLLFLFFFWSGCQIQRSC